MYKVPSPSSSTTTTTYVYLLFMSKKGASLTPEFPRLSLSFFHEYELGAVNRAWKPRKGREWLFRADGIMMFHKCRNCSFSWWVMENCVKDEWCSHLPFLSVRRFSSSSMLPSSITLVWYKTITSYYSLFLPSTHSHASFLSFTWLFIICMSNVDSDLLTKLPWNRNMFADIVITMRCERKEWRTTWKLTISSAIYFLFRCNAKYYIKPRRRDESKRMVSSFIPSSFHYLLISTHFTCSWLKMLMWCDPFSQDAKTENILHIFITILPPLSSSLLSFHLLPSFLFNHIFLLGSLAETETIRPFLFSSILFFFHFFKRRGNILYYKCHTLMPVPFRWCDEMWWWNYVFLYCNLPSWYKYVYMQAGDANDITQV